MKLLGLDVGTGGSRALVINAQGVIEASATVEHEPFASHSVGWAEQHPDDWWRASAAAIRSVLSKIPAAEIKGIGVTGQMHGAVVLDKDDKPIRPALIWCDQRTSAQCQFITEKIGIEKLIELTCNPALTNFTLTKLLWK